MIKIVRNDIELNVVASTLTLTTKNTAFSDSFSLDYSQHPFLIIEDKNTINALGSRHILSLNKQKEYEVTVFRDNKVYFGKLKVRSYVTGARKCDLVFGSELIKILDRPISGFMPIAYLGDQIPFSEDTESELDQDNLIDEIAIHETKSYPEVDFQFPEIYAPDFYDKEENDGEWKRYNGYLNRRGKTDTTYFFDNFVSESSKLLKNNITVSDINVSYENYNTLVPVVYLLSIIKRTFIQEGYTLIGNFKANNFIKSVSILSKNSNNCKYKPSIPSINFNIQDDFTQESIGFDTIYKYKRQATFFHKGTFKLSFNLLDIYTDANFSEFFFKVNLGSEELFSYEYTPSGSPGYIDIDDSITFKINNDNLFETLEILFFHNQGELPSSNSLIFENIETRESINYFHPTIDLSRHVPEWTVSELINNVKNLFNLKIDFDDSLKTVSLDFIDEYLNSFEIVDLSKFELEIKNYNNNQSDVFRISYSNGEYVRIDKNNINQNPVTEIDAIEIDNGFLTLPYHGNHHKLKKDDLEDGVILILNNPGTSNTVEEIDSQSLKLIGESGIAQKRWKDWVKFRQYASKVELVGKLPKHIIIQIEDKKKIYYDSIVFLVEEITTKNQNGYTEVILKVQSKAF